MTLIFTVLMGFSVLTGQYLVNASSALLYCVLATISGVFDIISCILYFQHSKYKLMDPKASSMALLAQLVFLTSPVSLFMSAWVSYVIFSDCRDHAQEFAPLVGFLDYGAIGWENIAAAQNINAATLDAVAQVQQRQAGDLQDAQEQQGQQEQPGPQLQTGHALVPFSGVGRRLDDIPLSPRGAASFSSAISAETAAAADEPGA